MNIGSERRVGKPGELDFVLGIVEVHIYCENLLLLAGKLVLAGEMVIDDPFPNGL